MENGGIKRGEIRREIRWLVLPIMAESIFALSGNLIFIAFLSRIDGVGLSSLTHVAAYGLSVIITGLVWNLLKGISIGATISLSQAVGAGERDRILQTGMQTVGLLFVLGCLSSILVYIFAEPIVLFYRPDAETLAISVRYIRICCFGFPFLGLMHASTGIMQGTGNTKVPMKFSAILNLVFIVVGVPLIFGWFGDPIGVVGSGFALVTGQVVTAAAGMLTLFGKRGLLRPAFKTAAARVSFKTIFTVLKLGLPTSLENIFWLLAAMVIGRVMLGFGDVQYAANQIGLQTESIATLPATSFGIVAMTLCGRAIGAKKRELGEAYLAEIKKSVYPVIAAGALLLLLIPGFLLSLMSNNGEVVSLASIYLRIMGACLPAISLSQVYLGALKSGGHTRTPMLIALAGLWCIRVPLSILAASIAGSTIVWLWYVVAIDLVARFAASVIVFRKTRLFERLTA
ncbi:MAG TPA: MATE family efflux transporter [Clostridiaceae bacterium]|jgi:putative MATE family efflux protein|nr:MATE family efflux transporter [Clostridiaceae bacterium]